MKKFLWDISGAFGDIGILFPLAIALISKNEFNPTALLACAGAFYILSAFYFKITMPVQPLKAMSAVAIATGLGAEMVTTAGLIMGIILILIAWTGISVRLGSLFPVSVIRGIQLGLGLILLKTGIGFMSQDQWIAILALIILGLGVLAKGRIPILIPVLMIGIVLSIQKIIFSELQLGLIPIQINFPNLNNVFSAFTLLVLPQIALTFGNAIVATENAGKILYGDRARRLNLKSIPFSMGIANLISGVLGGAPMCHGSGGLTAHVKFGASGPRSGYIIGLVLLIMAIVFGKSSFLVISAFPLGILGALLFYVGILHAAFMKDILNDRSSTIVAGITALVGLVSENLTYGFLAGMMFHVIINSYVNRENSAS